tara:strand:+ start:506 stop:880 length:375 start_codon:yes stop_codon:yes gene_type:complete
MSSKKYTKDHEWILIENNIGTVGITNHAQESLGDIVFIELPEIGKIVKTGSEVSVVESVKAASDIYSPIDGKIIDINNKLKDDPSIVNQDAENDGWFFKIEISDSIDEDKLMSLEQYNKFIEKN